MYKDHSRAAMNHSNLKSLIKQVSGCTLCQAHLPHGIKPVLQIHPEARILIAGQAPGKKVHESGIPFDDASGKRLREWMGIDWEDFYNPQKIAILPMGFCYPGKGKSGDLPPRKECAPAWRDLLLNHLPEIKLTLAVGKYAQSYHLQNSKRETLTETVKSWKKYYPQLIPLPHPSPRNAIWISKHPWFEKELLPLLKARTSQVLETDSSSFAFNRQIQRQETGNGQ